MPAASYRGKGVPHLSVYILRTIWGSNGTVGADVTDLGCDRVRKSWTTEVYVNEKAKDGSSVCKAVG